MFCWKDMNVNQKFFTIWYDYTRYRRDALRLPISESGILFNWQLWIGAPKMTQNWGIFA